MVTVMMKKILRSICGLSSVSNVQSTLDSDNRKTIRNIVVGKEKSSKLGQFVVSQVNEIIYKIIVPEQAIMSELSAEMGNSEVRNDFQVNTHLLG